MLNTREEAESGLRVRTTLSDALRRFMLCLPWGRQASTVAVSSLISGFFTAVYVLALHSVGPFGSKGELQFRLISVRYGIATTFTGSRGHETIF